MTGIARAARWAGTALAGLSVRDLAGALIVAALLMAAGCWVLRDEDRSRRLAQIISAYGGSRAEGLAAYSRALATSHAVPPDTDLLAWSLKLIGTPPLPVRKRKTGKMGSSDLPQKSKSLPARQYRQRGQEIEMLT